MNAALAVRAPCILRQSLSINAANFRNLRSSSTSKALYFLFLVSYSSTNAVVSSIPNLTAYLFNLGLQSVFHAAMLGDISLIQLWTNGDDRISINEKHPVTGSTLS